MKNITLSLKSTLFTFPALIGAIIYLDEQGFKFDKIKTFSSASIIGGMIGSGYKLNEELIKVSKELIPAKSKSLDISFLSKLLYAYIDNGKQIQSKMSNYFIKDFKELKADIEFFYSKNNLITSSNLDSNIVNVPFQSLIYSSFSGNIIYKPKEVNKSTYSDCTFLGSKVYRDELNKSDLVLNVTCKNISFTHKDKFINQLSSLYSSLASEHITLTNPDKMLCIDTNISPLQINLLSRDIDNLVLHGYESASKWNYLNELKAL